MEDFLDILGETNLILSDILPPDEFLSDHSHLMSLSSDMYYFIESEIDYTNQELFDAADMMHDNFNGAFTEFVDYYNNMVDEWYKKYQ